jgi:hypothetical protein
MPSPFPGMNPYLEHPSVWHDFHERLIPALASQLGKLLLPEYLVRIDESVYVREPDDEGIRLVGRPDLFVKPSGHANGASRQESGTATLTAPRVEPVEVILDITEEERLSYLKVIDRLSNDVITVIEVLSPTNKRPGADRRKYLEKRNDVLRSPAHLIEIDLLRGGVRPLYRRPDATDYGVLVSRAGERPRAKYYSFSLPDPIPAIPVPLRGGEAEAELAIKAALDEVYQAAGYVYDIYRHEPEPPLTPEQYQWARSFLSATRSE